MADEREVLRRKLSGRILFLFLFSFLIFLFSLENATSGTTIEGN